MKILAFDLLALPYPVTLLEEMKLVAETTVTVRTTVLV